MEQSVRRKPRFQIFRDRFNELKGDQDDTAFAEKLGLSRQTVGFYKNGDRVPDALVLRSIAEKCNVSADWLLGLSDDPARKPCAVDELGLSPAAKDAIIRIRNYGSHNGVYPAIRVLSSLLESDSFYRSMRSIDNAKTLVAIEVNNLEGKTKDEIDAYCDETYNAVVEIEKALYEQNWKMSRHISVIRNRERIQLYIQMAMDTMRESLYEAVGYQKYSDIYSQSYERE